jgi:phosphatidylinositol 4-kinase
MLGGIIECIPNSYSRDQLGKAFEINLNQYFLKKYGNENSEKFRTARYNFIRSLAAYSVVSYILQIKDRHNGNIMVDEAGHLIHIDFGFIFDWSPGRDMRFESADFKLTSEFIELLGGSPEAEPYKLYVQKVIQGFLAIREHALEFMTLVELVFYSGYPCFKQDSLTKLLARFELDKTPLEAAAEMRKKINNAHDKWTTKVYDMIQHR